MKVVSSYKAINNEANFGPPIEDQVEGGAHITFELITKKGEEFFVTRWPNGLPRHEDPANSLRFPHGLMIFGESLNACVERLVKEQQGFSVSDIDLAFFDSYVDDDNHWHIEPGCIVEVTGDARVPKEASEIFSFTVDEIPELTFWDKQEFLDVIKSRLPHLIRK